MTVPTDQFTQLTHRGQDAFSAAVRAWQNTLRSYPGAAPSTEALPDVDATVDAAFDVAARVLDGQREFTKALVSIATQVADHAARAADVHATADAPVRPAEPRDEATREADVPAKADAPVRLAEPRDQAAGRTEPASGSTRAAPAAAPKRPRNGRRPDDA